jgi:transposase-like protein
VTAKAKSAVCVANRWPGEAAVSKILRATWQRCRVHFMRNDTAHTGETQRRIVSAWTCTAFAEADAPAAHAQWRSLNSTLAPS